MEYGYPARAVRSEATRSVAGMALTAGPMLLVPAHPAIAAVLWALFALFLAYGLRTLVRAHTRIRLDTDAIRAVGPRPRVIPWAALDGMRLNFYAAKRDRRDGWMELALEGGGRSLRIESTLDGFTDVVRASAAAAERGGVALSARTRDNLAALGLEPKGGAAARR